MADAEATDAEPTVQAARAIVRAPPGTLGAAADPFAPSSMSRARIRYDSWLGWPRGDEAGTEEIKPSAPLHLTFDELQLGISPLVDTNGQLLSRRIGARVAGHGTWEQMTCRQTL